MMGGPIDARKSPTAVNNLAMTRAALTGSSTTSSTACRPTTPATTGASIPGFLQHTGFVAMNPDRHLNAHWDYFNHLVEGDDDAPSATATSTTSTTPCSTCRPSTTSTPFKTVFQEFALPNGHWHVRGAAACGPQAITDTALLTIEGELDDISRQRPDRGRARALHRHSQRAPRALPRRRRPATTASSAAALAREHLPPRARVHRRPRINRVRTHFLQINGDRPHFFVSEK